MRNRVILFVLILALEACGGSKHNAVTPAQPPVKAVLTAPAQNGVCITGTVISDTQSSVTFIWNTSANTDSYDVVIKNLLTNTTSTQNTAQTQLTVNLSRSTPYSWYIVSKSTKVSATAQSDTWKFYNSGPGVVTYAPFPADITAPTFGQVVSTATINLTWTGSSVNNNIANYDVYFGTTNTPPLLKGAITDNFLNNVALTSKTTYYWKVVTRDTNGNTSDSELFQFTTN